MPTNLYLSGSAVWGDKPQTTPASWFSKMRTLIKSNYWKSLIHPAYWIAWNRFFFPGFNGKKISNKFRFWVRIHENTMLYESFLSHYLLVFFSSYLVLYNVIKNHKHLPLSKIKWSLFQLLWPKDCSTKFGKNMSNSILLTILSQLSHKKM